MTVLEKWAYKWDIPKNALKDLNRLYVQEMELPRQFKSDSEAAVQNAGRYDFSKQTGGILWRNNVGAVKDERGNYFRYGIANDSKKLNEKLKSADGIGIKPVVVTLEMVGSTIGQFVSVEFKRCGWKYAGTAREKAQLAWITLIESMGGEACFMVGKKNK